MSDLVGNPKDRFSCIVAQIDLCIFIFACFISMPGTSIDDGRMLKNISKRRLSAGGAGKGMVKYRLDP